MRPPRTRGAKRAGIPRRRLFAFAATVVVMFVLLGARVVELQTVSAERYVALGEDQTVRTQVLAADRGNIYDRNGFDLALTIPVKTVFTDPRFVDDPRAAAEALAPVVGGEVDELEQVLGADNSFGYLARQVDEDVAAQVEELGLEGVYTLEEPTRYVPSGDIGESLVGRTDIDNIGIGGLEMQYDEVLTGTPGELTVERDPSGRTIPIGEHDLVPAVKGDDLVLTVDRPLQFEAERRLVDQVTALGAQGGVVVVSNPRTGELLALANVDTDPDTGEARVSPNNMALTTVYEPGSVMKLITMSMALEHGEADPETCVPAPDSLQIADKSFTEYKPHGGGCWLPADVIARSSNTASINLALRLGDQRLYDGFKAFGLGEPTGLAFPNEQSGFVRPPEDWWSTSIGSMAIGQGISVTPVQMAMAFNAIANDGVYVPPQLVHSTVDPAGVEHLSPIAGDRQVVSPETAEAVTEMLRQVVERGTAEAAQVDGYSVCGKTGTALKPFEGGYTGPDGRTHYIATFAGFAPCDDPAISIYVAIDDAQSSAYTGGAVSAPVFAQIADFALRHYEVPATGTPGGLPLDPAAPAEGGPVQAPPAGTVPEGLVPDGRTRESEGAGSTGAPPSTESSPVD